MLIINHTLRIDTRVYMNLPLHNDIYTQRYFTHTHTHTRKELFRIETMKTTINFPPVKTTLKYINPLIYKIFSEKEENVSIVTFQQSFPSS